MNLHSRGNSLFRGHSNCLLTFTKLNVRTFLFLHSKDTFTVTLFIFITTESETYESINYVFIKKSYKYTLV